MLKYLCRREFNVDGRVYRAGREYEFEEWPDDIRSDRIASLKREDRIEAVLPAQAPEPEQVLEEPPEESV